MDSDYTLRKSEYTNKRSNIPDSPFLPKGLKLFASGNIEQVSNRGKLDLAEQIVVAVLEVEWQPVVVVGGHHSCRRGRGCHKRRLWWP